MKNIKEEILKLSDLILDNLNENWQETSWSIDGKDGKEKTLTIQDLLKIVEKNNVPITKMPTKSLMKEAQRLLKKDSISEERVKKADLNYPIIVLNVPNNTMVIDGNHRLIKAMRTKQKDIKVRKITLKDIPKEFHEIFV